MRALLRACTLALASGGLIADTTSAQPTSGFYLSQEIGLNVAPPVQLLGKALLQKSDSIPNALPPDRLGDGQKRLHLPI